MRSRSGQQLVVCVQSRLGARSQAGYLPSLSTLRSLPSLTLDPPDNPGFQKLAMDAMAAAKLIGWGGRVLYLGPAFGLTPHRHATAVLAVGLDDQLEVADDPADGATDYRAARSVLILPNSLHHLRIGRGRMAFLYVDPLGRDLKALIARMT